ncbi:hypothetical protein E2C01_090396 [Portunus trituberculatus]|uniref:Uncharacterized protein n=1 Tax=Portunus trituberculatus TaxID=210409 RepID=A0A5B7JPZ9_PORTR|nr:hypothetical protein [Portunus trituberculatus]
MSSMSYSLQENNHNSAVTQDAPPFGLLEGPRQGNTLHYHIPLLSYCKTLNRARCPPPTSPRPARQALLVQ